MKNWLREHGLAMRDALVRLGRHFVATVLNLLVIGIALSLPLALYILLENVSAFSQQAAAEPQLTLFLRNDADQTDAQSMEARLRAHPAVARVQFVTKDRALANLEKSAGLSGVVEELGSNPLPDAFVITGHAEQAEALESLRIEPRNGPRSTTRSSTRSGRGRWRLHFGRGARRSRRSGCSSGSRSSRSRSTRSGCRS
jgi:cell division transport system permease protein